MEFTNISLNIGLSRPLRFLHITDSHLTVADERDDMRKRELAATRTRDFHDVMHEPGEALARLEEAITYAREHCDLLVHTGDVIDFVSHPNFERLRHLPHATDTIFAAGNHEFSIYIGEAKEDDAYKARHFKAVQNCSPNDIDFCARIVHGVNLVNVDNSYFEFKPRHLLRLKEEVSRGLPILLFMHIPIHTMELYHEMMVVRRREAAHLVGTPEELLQRYSPERQEQQRPTSATLEFIDYVKQQPLIKAVFCGHMHFPFQSRLTPDLPQFVAGPTFDNFAAIVEIS